MRQPHKGHSPYPFADLGPVEWMTTPAPSNITFERSKWFLSRMDHRPRPFAMHANMSGRWPRWPASGICTGTSASSRSDLPSPLQYPAVRRSPLQKTPLIRQAVLRKGTSLLVLLRHASPGSGTSGTGPPYPRARVLGFQGRELSGTDESGPVATGRSQSCSWRNGTRLLVL